jgi:chemotaxis signal transduction protein
MPRYKSIELEERLIPMIRHMHAVEEYREVLQNLQAVWDNLTLLGQLSGVGTDMNSTRQAFNQLTSSLLNQLCAETLKKTVAEMTAKAQVAIDILVRNLFERTADIGFLATDEDVRHFLREFAAKQGNIHHVEELNTLRRALRGRFADYVNKYSVYSDIVLLDPSGRVVARLDDSVTVEYSTDPLIAEAMSTTAAYVESYRRHDLLPDRVALGYSYRVTDEGGKPIGVLFLCFRLENELERIFSNLAAGDDWTSMTLVDNDGRVVASSDGFHVPLGAPLEKVLGEEYRIVRFGGREYLSVTRPTQGYQGYMGPGWYGHAMLPIQHAFNLDSSEMLRGIAPAILADVMGNTALFGEELRRIPEQAERIQADLNRSVWNGNVRLGSTRQAINATFSKILLWEISNTGGKTKDVFERSIANLHETVVSAILQDSRFVASLAIDIMDRNLYERANDSRWWALTSAFRQTLTAGEVDEAAAQQLSGILSYINGLYTVYSNLLLFDANGRVLAVSNPEYASLVGQVVQEEWARRVLALTDTQGYAVSAFNPSPLYGGRHTYIYGAAVRSPDGRNAIGGVGIVFDAAPQFAAMLCDALPRDKSGATVAEAFAVFAEKNGRVIACSDDRLAPGDNVGLEPGWLAMGPGSTRAGILRMSGRYYAVGASASRGYREYKGPSDGYRNDVTALVFLPLCEAAAQAQRPEIPRLAVESDRGGEAQSIEIATFHIGGTWFGLHSGSVVEAVDPSGITSVPGAGHIFAGYLIYDGLPTPVYDIGAMANAHSELPVYERQVIILRREDDVRFGILVDGLGEIPEIGEARLQPLPTMLAGGNVLGEAIVKADPGSENQLLLVLGADRIAARLKIPNPEVREALPLRREAAVHMIGP